ncbi:putative DNA primase/helicase [Klebsiella phage vB_KaeD_HazelMika]|nr:putative DNA primase/helicase [Klebsiella phage vB_KaeD_HazelMika]
MNEMFQKEEVLPYMKGLWREALQSVCGVPSIVFNKKHQSCPSCGGKDRFRWTDKLEEPGDGGAYCNSCGADKGIGWMMRLTGEPYSEVINILGRFLGKVPQEYRVKANKRATRDNGYTFGKQIDHEACIEVMSRTELRSSTPLTVFEGLYGESYSVGVKSRPDGSDEFIHALPCHMVHDDGLDDEMCNIMFSFEDGSRSFLAKDYTRGAVIKVGESEGAIYLVNDWADGERVNFATNQEVWVCTDASNLEIVAYRYKGERELRVACLADDLQTLYMADDRELKVIVPNGSDFKTGMRRQLFNAQDLIDSAE